MGGIRPRVWLTVIVGSAVALMVLPQAGTAAGRDESSPTAPSPARAQFAQANGEEGATAAGAEEFAPKGAMSCLRARCHDKAPATLILRTPHAQSADPRTPFAVHDCETCHGASPEHASGQLVEGGQLAPIARAFGRDSPTPVSEQNRVCLECHQAGLRMNWGGSQHQLADMLCVACHDIHTLEDLVLTQITQPRVCFDCHTAQRAQSYRFSHHPIREGLVPCSDCHNPHGSFGPRLLREVRVNDTCYDCHAEKRGPFLWEHPPVVENCTYCHAPHGSTQPRLLKARAPFLCQSCHMEAFHPSTLYSGEGVPPRGVQDRLLAKACLNCHSQIHGSNHPSGVRFMR